MIEDQSNRHVRLVQDGRSVRNSSEGLCSSFAGGAVWQNLRRDILHVFAEAQTLATGVYSLPGFDREDVVARRPLYLAGYGLRKNERALLLGLVAEPRIHRALRVESHSVRTALASLERKRLVEVYQRSPRILARLTTLGMARAQIRMPRSSQK